MCPVAPMTTMRTAPSLARGGTARPPERCRLHGVRVIRTPVVRTISYEWFTVGDMRLGTSIFLLAVGAILAFAVTVSVSGIDLATVGVILMVVGVLGIVLEFALFRPRSRVSTSVTSADPAAPATVRRSTTRDL